MGRAARVKARRERGSESELEGPASGATASRTASANPAWLPGESDIHALTVPPGEYPTQNLPGSIEEAVLNALDQVPAASHPPARPASRPAPATTPPPARQRRTK